MNLLGFFSSEDFMPHGHCFLWRSDLLLLHVLCDAVIAVSYYSIPFALIYFIVKRPDVVFRWIAVLFGVFILACGTTHILGIVVVWNPIYWVDGGVKAVTAIASIATAVIVWRIMPQALAIPSTAQLRGLNAALEDRVRDRTLDLERSNAELQSAIKAKEVLLQEVHHRVKNNLQVVSALLAMQSQKAPDLGRHFQDSASRIEAMGRVHDQLHRVSNVAALDLGNYLEALAGDLARIYGRNDIAVRFSLPAKPVWIDLEAANPLVLLLNEALSNVLKHAFPERSGQVDVGLDASDDGPVVTIADDGIGLSHGILDGAKESSMGMNLIKMLAEQIGARFDVSEGKGTTFTVRLPRSLVVQA